MEIVRSVDHQVNKKRKIIHTANEGPVRIQYKGLVPIYVFTEMKLLFPKHNYYVLSRSSYTHISVRDLYISRIGTEAAQFPEKEYINGIFVAVHAHNLTQGKKKTVPELWLEKIRETYSAISHFGFYNFFILWRYWRI